MNRKKLRSAIEKILLEKISGESLYDPGYASKLGKRSSASPDYGRISVSSPSQTVSSGLPGAGTSGINLSGLSQRARNALPWLAGIAGTGGAALWLSQRDGRNVAVVERDSMEPYIFPVSTPEDSFNSFLGSEPSLSRVIPDTVDDDGNVVRGEGSRPHAGWDIRVAYKTVVAMDSGEVTDTGYARSGGNFIKIKHSNSDFSHSYYYHMSSIDVEKDERVTKGQIIGKSGNSGLSTGPHLHLTLIDSDSAGSGTSRDFYLNIFSKCSSWYLVELDNNNNPIGEVEEEIPEVPKDRRPPATEEREEDSYDNPEAIRSEIQAVTTAGLFGLSATGSGESDLENQEQESENIIDQQSLESSEISGDTNAFFQEEEEEISCEEGEELVDGQCVTTEPSEETRRDNQGNSSQFFED